MPRGDDQMVGPAGKTSVGGMSLRLGTRSAGSGSMMPLASAVAAVASAVIHRSTCGLALCASRRCRPATELDCVTNSILVPVDLSISGFTPFKASVKAPPQVWTTMVF